MSKSIKELTLDLKDYREGGTVFKRQAVRGIIRHKDRYLVIHGKYGDYKFPGGGRKRGEELLDTLIREVQEETGYRVVADSVTDYILVHEKRKGDPDDLLEMDSWYYFCDVEETAGKRNLDDYEKEYDYQVAWMSLPEIIRKNETVEQYEKIPWIVRETMVMNELLKMNAIRVALLQIAPTGTLEGNMEKGLKACRQAKELGADIALFPEMWNCGYRIPEDIEELKSLAIGKNSPFLSEYKRLAKELNMAIGVTFLEAYEPCPRNTICLIDRFGNEVYTYAKVHTCNFGDECRLTSGEEFYVAELDTAKGNVKVGSMICYDREFPESARILMLKGAELLLVPNACPMEINRISQLRARAYENMLGIATVNYPGNCPDCNGHSTAFDGIAYRPQDAGSRDTLLLEADETEGIFTVDFPIDEMREYRGREVHGNAYRRPEKYGLLLSEEIREPFIRRDRRRTVRVNFYEEVEDVFLKFAVIIAKTEGKYVFCKHKERDTWEVPGGHREPGEDISDTAKRELYEETGALDFDIKPICVYSVTAKDNFDGQESFGKLYYAEIRQFEQELHREIEKIVITDELPLNWTYPEIQPKLMEEAKKRGLL